MAIFLKTLEMELRLYRRGTWLWIVMLLLTVYLISGYQIFVRSDMNAGQLLQSSAYIIMAGFLLGMVAGILSARREQTEKFEEVMVSLPGDVVRALAKMSAWGVIVLILTAISIAEVLLIYAISKSQLIQFWSMSVVYIIVYWSFPFLSAGLIGFALERMVQSKIKYLVMFLLWLLTSPYNGVLFFLPKSIAFWLNQAQTDPSGIYNAYTGYEITRQTIHVHLFLLLFAIALVLLSFLLRRAREYTKTGKRNLLLATVVVFLMASFLPIFTPVHVDSPTLSLQDYNFYMDLQAQHPLEKPYNEPPDYQVDDYRMNLVHQERTIAYSINMKIHVPEKAQLSWLPFTLSHHMRVSDVQVDTNKVPFRQEGDLLFIQWPKANGDGDLKISAGGSPGIGSPVTSDSFFLSASHPWYPVPGKWRVAARPAYAYGVQFVNVEFPYDVRFHVTVEESQRVFSNLSEKNQNEFVGQARGITLLAGKLLEMRTEGKHIVAPPDLIGRIPSLLPHMQLAAAEVGDKLGAQPPLIPDTIFVVPLPDRKLALLSDQLQLDVSTVQVFSSREEEFFAAPRQLIRAFFWENRLHDGTSSIGPALMFSLYEQLYGENRDDSYSALRVVAHDPKPEYPELQQMASQLLALYERGRYDLLEIGLQRLYQYLNESRAANIQSIQSMIEQIATSR